MVPSSAAKVATLAANIAQKRPFGLRQPGDPCSFNLMDEETGRVRRPSEQELAEICAIIPQYRGYRISRPYIILEMDTMPENMPVTVGGLPARYTENMFQYKETWGELGNPGLEDFGGSEFKVEENRFPSFRLVDQALKRFAENLNGVVAVHYHLRYWLVQLEGSYDVAKLPGCFGGRAIRYIPELTTSNSRQRLLTPSETVADNTDYRAFGLTPGIRVCGKGYPSTAGVMVMHRDGRRRLTLANHGFWDTNDVFHPDTFASFELGKVVERYYFNDIALCDVLPSTKFSNKSYFEANIPKKMIDAYTLERSVTAECWFEVDGMTTGRVFLLYSGPGSRLPRLQGELSETHVFEHQLTFDYFGPAKVARDGVCGAPIIHQPTSDPDLDGAIVGFFFWADVWHAVTPTLDRFLNEGWVLADQ